MADSKKLSFPFLSILNTLYYDGFIFYFLSYPAAQTLKKNVLIFKNDIWFFFKVGTQCGMFVIRRWRSFPKLSNLANSITEIMYFENKLLNNWFNKEKVKLELEIRLENFLDWKLAWTIISFFLFSGNKSWNRWP